MWSSDQGGVVKLKRNPQTAASNELTVVQHLKRWVASWICKQNSRCLRESSNCSWLDKKLVKWNVTMKLCGLNSFHSNTKRKKERSKKWWAHWLTSKFKTSANMSCMWSARSIEKTEAWASLGVQFVGHASCLWWDRVCDICKFQPARTGIKGVISALLLLLLLHLLLHSRAEQTSVLTWQARKTGPAASS